MFINDVWDILHLKLSKNIVAEGKIMLNPLKQNYKIQRSVLYMPASNARAIEKSRNLGADAIILDLEDAVAPDAKDIARHQACAAIIQGGFGKCFMTIRMNSLETIWGEADLKAIIASGIEEILVPKISSVQDIDKLQRLIKSLGGKESIKLGVMIETPQAIFNIYQIAHHPFVSRLVMGTNDLLKDIHGIHISGRPALITALQMAILAAKSANKPIIDGVFNDLNDEEGFKTECEQGHVFGFDGKTLIHPKQIPACHEIFTPSEADIILAGRQVKAFEEALLEGKGIAVLDGKIIENLHIVQAKRILAFADYITLSS